MNLKHKLATRVLTYSTVLAIQGTAVSGFADAGAKAESRVASPAVPRYVSSKVTASPPPSAGALAGNWDSAAVGSVDAEVFRLALNAASEAIQRGVVTAPTTLTVIDFSRPSTEKRMWVYDLQRRSILFEEWVSHGRGSGLTLATSFSNTPESNQSSLGLFLTAEPYVGKNGYSLRLDGLEPGINDRARDRAIVIHGAPYVDPAAAKVQGYLGRSLGCPALRPAVTRQLIDTIKEGSLLFAYYPDERWLRSSGYVAASYSVPTVRSAQTM